MFRQTRCRLQVLKRQLLGEVTMKKVRTLLTLVAATVALSAGTTWAQCCGGASYDTVGAAAPANGCGCSYTVMQTRRRVVNETRQETRTRTVNRTVYDNVQVPVTRNVSETAYRTESYQVQRPVTNTVMETQNYTVQRPVRENIQRTVNYLSLIHI